MGNFQELNNKLSGVSSTIITPKQRAIYDSNINRLKSWIQSKDVASITAFRSELANVHNPSATLMDKSDSEDKTYSKEENKKRNDLLSKYLRRYGYGITKIAGVYKEDGKNSSSEDSYFVVNLPDDPNFKKNLFKISEWFNQDSFLYKPAGSDDAYLIGTNDNSDIPYGSEVNIGKFVENVSSEAFSRIKNKGYAFGNKSDMQTFENKDFKSNKAQRIENQVQDDVITEFHKRKFSSNELARLFYEDAIRLHGHLAVMGLIKMVSDLRDQGYLPE